MASYLGRNVIPLPTVPRVPRSIEYLATDIVGSADNPFTGQDQTQNWNAAWLEWSVSYQVMTNAQVQAWIAFLMALNGVQNLFQLGDPLNRGPQNPLAVAPNVSGGGQTGFSLVTSGAGLLTVGDWINLPTGVPGNIYHLHKITAINGPTLTIWPPIRESPVDGAPCPITNTTGIWSLKANSRKWSVAKDKTYTLTFECREFY